MTSLSMKGAAPRNLPIDARSIVSGVVSVKPNRSQIL
jgi:hypothetical protein